MLSASPPALPFVSWFAQAFIFPVDTRLNQKRMFKAVLLLLTGIAAAGAQSQASVKLVDVACILHLLLERRPLVGVGVPHRQDMCVHAAALRHKFDHLSVLAKMLLSFNPVALSSTIPGLRSRSPMGSSEVCECVGRQHLPAMSMDAVDAFSRKLEKLSKFAADMQENLRDDQGWRKLPAHFAKIRDNARVAPSSRHSLGLFAKSDLEKGEIATFYPTHTLGNLLRVTLDGQDVVEKHFPIEYQQDLLHTGVVDIFSGVDVRLPDVPGWLGHRANDATVCFGTSKEAILQYYEKCERECNCILLPFGDAVPIMLLLTTRAVQQGEELLHCYHHAFWTGRLRQKEGADPESTPADFEYVPDFAARRSLSMLDMRRRYHDCISNFEGMLQSKYDWQPAQSASDVILQEPPKEVIMKALSSGHIDSMNERYRDDAGADSEERSIPETPVTWKQTIKEVTLMLPVKDVDRKDVQCDFMEQRLRVKAAGASLEGELWMPIAVDDCYWLLSESDKKGSFLEIVLLKTDQEVWDEVFNDEPQVSGFGDMEEEAIIDAKPSREKPTQQEKLKGRATRSLDPQKDVIDRTAGDGKEGAYTNIPMSFMQTETEVTVFIPLKDKAVDAKDVHVKFMKQSLQVRYKELSFEAKLFGPVIVEDCLWALGDNNEKGSSLEIFLQKVDESEWDDIFDQKALEMSGVQSVEKARA